MFEFYYWKLSKLLKLTHWFNTLFSFCITNACKYDKVGHFTNNSLNTGITQSHCIRSDTGFSTVGWSVCWLWKLKHRRWGWWGRTASAPSTTPASSSPYPLRSGTPSQRARHCSRRTANSSPLWRKWASWRTRRVSGTRPAESTLWCSSSTQRKKEPSEL